MEALKLLLLGLTLPLLYTCPPVVIAFRHRKSSPHAVKAAYWPSDTISYSHPSTINTALYTHLLYAFADLDGHTFRVGVPPENQKSLAEFTPTLLKTNPYIKTLISVGGGGSNGKMFAIMAADASLRKTFIHSSIALARRNGFHGLDLDWEFPQNTVEMENLGKLFCEWRRGIEMEAMASGRPRLLLTAAVYFAQHFFVWGEKRAYPSKSIAENLDWVNVMNYEYHGSWDTYATGAPAALYDPASNVSTSFGIGSWLSSGVPPHKVAMGIPLYGHSWRLKSDKEFGIGAPAVAAGPKQNVSDDEGTMFFFEIRNFIRENNATEAFDGTTVSAYCYAGDVWVGYDNEESVAGKVVFAKGKRLLGYFFWAVSQDSDWMLSRKASVTWDKS
eukprot:Gb_04931 [translate_table: standard]